MRNRMRKECSLRLYYYLISTGYWRRYYNSLLSKFYNKQFKTSSPSCTVIALILVVMLFVILMKKVAGKAVFKRFVFITVVLAFMLNFAWEVIQIHLYKGASINRERVAFCALASVADAIMVLLIYLGFALIYKNPLWNQDLTLPRILVLMLAGGLWALLPLK